MSDQLDDLYEFDRELAERVRKVKEEYKDYRIRMVILTVGIGAVLAILAGIIYFAFATLTH